MVALIVIGLVFGVIFGVADPDAGGRRRRGLLVSTLAGFISYGIVVGIALAIITGDPRRSGAGVIFSGGQVSAFQGVSAVQGVGLASGGVQAAIALFIVHILGGYVGGRISGPEKGDGSAPRPSRIR